MGGGQKKQIAGMYYQITGYLWPKQLITGVEQRDEIKRLNNQNKLFFGSGEENCAQSLKTLTFWEKLSFATYEEDSHDTNLS